MLPHVDPEESTGLGLHPDGLVVDIKVGQGEDVGLGLH